MLFVEICTVIVLARSDIMRDVQVTAMSVHEAQGQQQTRTVSADTLKPHVTPKTKQNKRNNNAWPCESVRDHTHYAVMKQAAQG